MMGAQELAIVGLAGSGVGTALSVPMVWPRSGRTLDVRLLGTAVLLMSVIAALISARLAGLAPASLEIGHAINVLGMSTMPLVVLYVRHAVGAGLSGRLAFWWAPAAIYTTIVVFRSALGLDTRVQFATILPIVLTFTIVSVATLWRHHDARRQTVVPVEWIVTFCVLVNAAQIVRMEFAHIGPVRALVPLVFSLGFIAMAGYAVWQTVGAISMAAAPAAAPRYERSGVEDALAAQLLARIDEALTRDRLFARADLTLAQLASAIDATSHQVSEALNRCAGVSFHDLLNRRRVDDVKAQLRDPASDGFTIEGIGASSGFGSRSALYAAFRRYEGTTPTAFRAKRLRG